MSKNKKAGKKSNTDHPRSKNNPDGERNDPQIDWAGYNKGHRAEGRLYTEWMQEVAGKVREIMANRRAGELGCLCHTGGSGQTGGEIVLLGTGQTF